MASMDSNTESSAAFWSDGGIWRRSANNTAWCLAGCAFGDMGTVLYFQLTAHNWPTMAVFALAMLNGPACEHCAGNFYFAAGRNAPAGGVSDGNGDEFYFHAGGWRRR